MAKQLNVNLAFTADTSQAKAQLQNLQTQLSGLLNSTSGQSFGNQITGDINKASKAIAELKLHLQNATNVNTGNLDFTKLNESLNKSGTTLQQYGDKLRSLGPAGQQAFNALAQSVAQSEIPIRRSNAALTEMWTTLKNTARWQISSSILHGFMGSISAAVGYAKDLNKSLNDIRIVTGASVDEMARFAEQANRSAKALSASTTEYTKASLIYYQQGLDDQAVKERTDVTIKMANVSGQTAEMVSDQMTAVWNNFAKGGEDLERFADVMVRLGADTASSSDEIAQGLEKFAAIGDMVGLSFDNAAAALATVTATTRQSADVVGTAFKTIFARIQGLKLGETLEDGTDLNKYSEALAAVGISIKEQNGELKDMDNILAEMGAKWKTLSKDQQVALAQTVAGLRQYNQLVALMENFDFYEQNLQSAATADGSLQKQADIYAESWQAASNRVKAATQGIYEDLLNDEAFIDVLNTIEKILTYIDNLIDGLGGLGGVLTTVGALLTRAFSAQIAQGITSMTNGIKMMTVAGREQAQQQKAQFMKDSADAMRGMSDGSNEGNMRATMMEDQLRLQTSMIENSERMSAEEQQINQMLLDRQRILSDNAIAAAKELDAATEAKSDATMEARTDIASARINRDQNVSGDNRAKNLTQLNKDFTALQIKMKDTIKIRADFKELSKIPEEGRKSSEILNTIKEKAKELNNVRLNGVVSALKEADLEGENFEVTMAKLDATMERVNNPNIVNMSDMGIRPETIEQLIGSMEREVAANEKVEQATNEANAARDRTQASINGATGAQKTWADQMVAGANVVMSVMSALQALNGIIDVATNPDMSGWEKFLSIGSSLAMMFVMLAPLLQGTNLQFLTMAATSIAGALGVKTFSAAEMEAAISGNMAAAGTATFATALWTLLWPIGLVMAAIAALVLVVGGLIKLFKSFDEGEKLKRLEEEAQNASEAFDRTKEKINETKTALDSLESGYDTIEKLKEGTLEWYEAIGNVNAEVMKLAETYPDLAQHIYSDNGVLKINEDGQAYLSQEMERQYATAANYKMSTQIRVNDQKLEMGKSDYIDPTGGMLMVGADNYQKITQLMQAAYETPEIGETLFTQQGAQSLAYANYKEAIKYDVDYALGTDYEKFNQEARDKFVDSLGTVDWSNTDAIEQTAKEAFGTTDFEGVDFSQLSEDLLYQRDNMEMLLDANEEHIKGQKALKDSNKRLQDAQFESVLSSMGSTRTADEGKELLGGRTYENIKTEQKAKLTGSVDNGGFGNWNDHINYKDSDPEMKLIEDFMKQVGASDYVAQRNGKMVLEIDGEEKEFSKDEVINTLTDMYSTGAAQEEIQNALVPVIQDAYGIATEGLDAEQLVNLDELARGIKEGMSRGFQGSEEELNQKVNEMTQGIGKAYGSDAEALAADTSYINFDDAEIQRKITGLIQQLNEGTIEAEEFRVAIQEINAVGELNSLSGMFKNAAAAMGGSKDEIAQNAAEMQNYAKHLMEVSKESDELSDELATNADSAADLAVEVTRMNKGVDKLADGIENWSSILKTSSKTSQEYGQALGEMRGVLADILDVNADLISNDFMIDPGNLALIEEAAKGSGEAIDALRAKMDEELILNITAGQTDEFIAKVNELDSVVQDLATNLPDIEVGAILDDTEFLAAANNLVQQSGMTADEANAYFAGIGYEPVYNSEEIPDATSMESPNVSTTMTVKSLGFSEQPISIAGKEIGFLKAPQMTIETESTPLQPTKNPADMRLTSFSGGNTPPKIRGMRKKASGGMNNYSKSNSGGKSPGSSGGGGGGGGGGSTPKKIKTDHKKKHEEVERYHEINQALEDLQNNLDEIGQLKEEVWGENKLKAMDAEKKKLGEIITVHKQYQSEIAKNLNDDRWEAESHYGAIIDPETGRITNYEELQQQWMDEWNAASDKLDVRENAAGDNEEEKNAIEEERKLLDEEYEAKRHAIEQYEETLNLSEEAKQQLDDYYRQIRQLNYEKLEYTVELRVEVKERDIEDIEQSLERLDKGYVFHAAERIAFIENNAKTLLKVIDDYKEEVEQATLDYQKFIDTEGLEGIDQAQYMEIIQKAREQAIDAENRIREGIAQIGEELINVFDLIDGKIDRQYDKFDSLTNLMEHYKNVVSLTEGEASYKKFNNLLKAQQEIIKDRIKTEKNEVAMWEARRQQLEASQKNMIEGSSEWLAAQDALDDIMDKENEAKSQLMADIEQLSEYAREIFENSIEQAMKDFEDEMFGRPLNSIIESIEMMNSRQEELLTTTNKIYETNKLIRNVEKDIEATTNKRAKQAFAEFQNKVKQKQEQNELTKFELDLLTAEYEITKAQIALEEAQNTKDTVRLTRDAEGNYGYVYTANEDKVADAEQALDDAINNYYNTALEGAQRYQDQIYQHIQEWEEKVKEVYLDQTLSEEEKNKKIKEINDTYNTLISQDKELYYTAIGAMQETSYNTQVDYDLKGIESAENWFTECDGFIEDMKAAQQEYDANTEEVATHTEENFGDMKDSIEEAKKESSNLRAESENLIDQFNIELLDSVNNATLAWEKYNEQLLLAIQNTKDLQTLNQQVDELNTSDDFAQSIIDEFAKGEDADLEYIKKLTQKRDIKLDGLDLTDYSEILARPDLTEAQRKAYTYLRIHKIEKMAATDYTQMLFDYLAKDGKLEDQRAKDILTMREQKMAVLGLDIISNEELIEQIKGKTETTNQSQEVFVEEAPTIEEKTGPSQEDIKAQARIIYQRIWNEGAYGNGWENRKQKAKAEFGKNFIEEAFQLAKDVINGRASFNTGGYTGNWGPEGKLAILHEKELVLNKEDTTNFLTATEILREISTMLDNNALIASLGAINLSAMTIGTSADQVLQQEVTIHADFPNVTDHNEIEIAIDNLINAASQHAYKI